eukprot:tig00020903_g15113.t1
MALASRLAAGIPRRPAAPVQRPSAPRTTCIERATFWTGVRRATTSSGAIRVNELFYSVQGEGPHVGRPSVFIRLGLCNLQCAWCDTKYTWLFDEETLQRMRKEIPPERSHYLTGIDKPFSRAEEITKKSVDDLIGYVQAQRGAQAVVITGGEPLIQKQPLLPLVQRLRKAGYAIEFETNGTFSPSGIQEGVHFNVSPKLSSAGNPKQLDTLKPDILREFLSRESAVFKFVVRDMVDLKEVQAIARDISIPASRLYVMPEGTSPEQIQQASQWLVEICKEHGYIYSHRLHLVLFGAKRGT